MATEPPSVKAKVASDGPREAPNTPEQSSVQSSSEAKDTETLFKEAFQESEKMTSEERREKFPILKSFTPSTVNVDKGMEMLEEMERDEAAKPDGTATIGMLLPSFLDR